jgi:drug/metabolite transporter (DMT)-like permease
MPPSPLRSRALLLVAAVLFSTGGAAIKAASLTGWQVACFRSGAAALFLLLAIPEARRGWSWRMLPVSLAYASTLVLFVLSTRMTTAANAIFLQSSAPLYVLLLGPVLLHEAVRRADVVFIGAVACGIGLFFLDAGRAMVTAPNPGLGNMLAVASGLAWALTLVGLRWLGRGSGPGGGMATVVAGNLAACLIALPAALPIHDIHRADVLVIAYLAIFQIGLAYVCLTAAMRHVPALEATALLLVEPALNPVWAWMVHGERPGPWAIAGGATILCATLVKAWWQSREPTPATA